MKDLRFVEDVTGLRGLRVHHQNQLVLVKETGETYWFDAASDDLDDGFLVIRPIDIALSQLGRWRLVE